MNYMGYDVIIAGNKPRMTTPAALREIMSPLDVMKHDEWLKKFFGVECMVPKGQMVVMQNMRKIVMHPEDYLKMGNAIAAARPRDLSPMDLFRR